MKRGRRLVEKQAHHETAGAYAMHSYFDFFDRHGLAVLRCFFGLTMVVDLAFLYAIVFNRNLPRKWTMWFFGGLSGQQVGLPPVDDGAISWWQWVAFGFVEAVPPVAWLVVECVWAAHRRA